MSKVKADKLSPKESAKAENSENESICVSDLNFHLTDEIKRIIMKSMLHVLAFRMKQQALVLAPPHAVNHQAHVVAAEKAVIVNHMLMFRLSNMSKI